ncbi:ParA family protein [Cryptosporangium aurantiacum]|uniref:Cellulose biosynthesis protein BcsQ n=1 Tax=Cryptosporangium aurantiacum TaxID=134849 RepID=A0A1M7RQ23_9ACTN|nr:ParA family protein [Cryptosporangium aurantiacum]SHN48196.1 Cellulose biosynthesis protein BcsQ [Cryptosporangium aurantiacum]
MASDGARVLAVAGPKGGVSKTTTAVNTALNAARIARYRTLLVDADQNRSALDLVEAADSDVYPFTAAPGVSTADHNALGDVRRHPAFDLAVADLPGAEKSEALKALLTGDDGQPVVDGLILPTGPKVMDLRPLLRQVAQVIAPLGVPYLVALVRVHPHPDRMKIARTRQAELRAAGVQVAETITRELTAHEDAAEQHVALADLGGGRRSGAYAAEREYRELAAEALELVGLSAAELRKSRD